MASESKTNFYDVVVIGGGPAGLTAALYLARARYRVLVVEKEKFGGQITITSEVVNFPGVKKASGSELTDNMRKQAQSFGAEFMLAEVEKIDCAADIRKVTTDRGELECFGILLATGAHPRTIGFKGEEEFKGHGVAYCATCDGEFFTGKEVFVIGGGFAAAEESVFLTKYAKHVTILVREEDFTCAKAVAEKAKNHEKITVHYNVIVEEVAGDSGLTSIRYKNIQTGEVTDYHAPQNETFGVFVFAGYAPASDLVKDLVEVNEFGYIVTDRNQKTSVDGIYAAGDVCVKSLRQVVTAVGDGALAATELERWAAASQAKTGRKPEMPVIEKANEEEQENKAREEKQQLQQEGSLFTPDMLEQLHSIFCRMEHPLKLKLYLDDRTVSQELKQYMEELASLTDKLSVETVHTPSSVLTPCVKVCDKDGQELGLAFHGVPGGHEFTSFILGLYNAAGPGQALDEGDKKKIKAIHRPIDMKIMVSLTCTMCPELVTAAQHIAAENELVTAEVYDLNHFQEMKEKYNVMSVPCMVINDGKPVFGKKNIRQLLEVIE